jgi:hypothetical protein
VELVVTELGVVVDRDRVIMEATQFVDEVEEEDDGLWHAADAIGSLLRARLICLEDGIELPRAELERAGVAILARASAIGMSRSVVTPSVIGR